MAGRDQNGMCGSGGQHNTASNTTLIRNGTINEIHGHFGTVNAITWCSSRMIGFTTTLLPFLDGELSMSNSFIPSPTTMLPSHTSRSNETWSTEREVV